MQHKSPKRKRSRKKLPKLQSVPANPDRPSAFSFDFSKGMKATAVGYSQFVRVTDVAKSLIDDIKGQSRYHADETAKTLHGIHKQRTHDKFGNPIKEVTLNESEMNFEHLNRQFMDVL